MLLSGLDLAFQSLPGREEHVLVILTRIATFTFDTAGQEGDIRLCGRCCGWHLPPRTCGTALAVKEMPPLTSYSGRVLQKSHLKRDSCLQTNF